MSDERPGRTRFDVQWLTATEPQIQTAIEQHLPVVEQPAWVGKRTHRWAAASACVLLWYLAVVWVFLAARAGQGGLGAGDLAAILVTTAIAVVWARWTWRRYHAADEPGDEVHVQAHRMALTARANGYELQPARASFTSLMTGEQRGAYCYPRFTAAEVEFGNLKARGQSRARWHYLVVQLPGPQPHLFFDAVADGDLPPDLPRLDPAERITLGGVFDRTFRLYAPRPYATDALFLVPTNVMAALIDHAADFNVEIRDNNLIFFRSSFADFTDTGTWHTIGALLRDAVPPLLARAQRYRDQDVPWPEDESEETKRRRASYQAVVEELGFSWLRKSPSIGAVGRRLHMRQPKGEWRRFYLALGYWLLAMFYITPACVAIVAFLGVIGAL